MKKLTPAQKHQIFTNVMFLLERAEYDVKLSYRGQPWWPAGFTNTVFETSIHLLSVDNDDVEEEIDLEELEDSLLCEWCATILATVKFSPHPTIRKEHVVPSMEQEAAWGRETKEEEMTEDEREQAEITAAENRAWGRYP